MTPYSQGDLDGLCGVYAIINAIKLISKRKSLKEWQKLFLNTIRAQLKSKKSAKFLVNGITIDDLAKLLRKAIKANPGVTFKRPFKNLERIDLSDFWSDLQNFLNNSHNHRCAIIVYSTKTSSHWTVVQGISPNRLKLHDSIHSRFINRKTCTTLNLEEGKTVLIEFTSTLYLEAR